MSLSTLLTRFVICLRHGHEWRRTHRRDGTSYERCMGCDEVRGMNTWPDGKRRAMDQSEHEAWNASTYPGTRQLCSNCHEPTGRCEEDGLWNEDGEPLCEECHLNHGDQLP